MKHYSLKIISGYSLESAWDELLQGSFTALYSVEEDKGQFIVIAMPPGTDTRFLSKKFPWVESIQQICEGIDWESQWSAHAEGYENGLVHIDLKKYGYAKEGKVLLQPGPGFGDLSHPTTRLMLRMPANELESMHVLDIGCGSGVLTICAKAMKAAKAVGIDIDRQALEHAEKNAALNNMSAEVSFCLPSSLDANPFSSAKTVILMNMIWSEQEEAWSSLPQLHALPCDIYVSGVLAEERDLYLEMAGKRSWRLKGEREEDGWLAFHFRQGSQKIE